MAHHTIRLEKELIVRLFCLACEGYRSVHRAEQRNAWPAFRAYYSPEKRQAIQDLAEHLTGLLSPMVRSLPPPTVEELAKLTPSLSLARRLFGKWLNGRRQTWPLADREIRFLAATFTRFVDVLNEPVPPALTDLIALRIELCNCSGLFEARCYGLPELAQARHIEHFDHTPWVPHFKLGDILPEARAPVKVEN